MNTILTILLLALVTFFVLVLIGTNADIRTFDSLVESEWKNNVSGNSIVVKFYNPDTNNVVFEESGKRYKMSLENWKRLINEGKIIKVK